MKKYYIPIITTALLLPSVADSGVYSSEPAKSAVEIGEKPSPTFAGIGSWDSRYVLEGRDLLEGDSLYGFTLEAEYAGFLVGVWLNHSPEADYQEQNYFAEYGVNLGVIDAYVSYNHLQFMSDNDEDNEIGAGISWADVIFGWTPALDGYYGTTSGGYFAEASIAREFSPIDRLVILPSVIFGYNDGFVVDGHNGANNVMVKLIATYEIAENMAVEGYVAQTWAINSNPAQYADDGNLYDFSFGGVALSISF